MERSFVSNFTALLIGKKKWWREVWNTKQAAFQNDNPGKCWFSEACVKLACQYSTCENDHKERSISSGRITAPSEKNDPLKHLCWKSDNYISPCALQRLQLSYSITVKGAKVKFFPVLFSFSLRCCFAASNQEKNTQSSILNPCSYQSSGYAQMAT